MVRQLIIKRMKIICFGFFFFFAVSRRRGLLKRHGNGCRHGSGRRCWCSSPPPPSSAPPELVRLARRLVVIVPKRAVGGRQHVRPHELVFRAPPRRHAGRSPRGQRLPSPAGRSRRAVPPRFAHRHRSLLPPTDPLAVRTTPADFIAR